MWVMSLYFALNAFAFREQSWKLRKIEISLTELQEIKFSHLNNSNYNLFVDYEDLFKTMEDLIKRGLNS